jgi:Tol biopolymer transport system component
MLRRRLSIAATGLACAVWPALPGAGMPQGGPGAAKPFDVTVREGTSYSVTVSPDGRSIAMDLQGSIWIVPTGGGAAKRITDEYNDAREPVWSPDGKWIAFQGYRDGGWDIWAVAPDGSGLHQLTSGPYDDREPAWSHDGTRVAFSSDRGDAGNYNVWVLEVATGRMQAVTADPGDDYMPTWGPNDAEIAFVGTRGGVLAIYAATPAGTNEHRVAGGAARVDAPSWGPGGAIAYNVAAAGASRLEVDGKAISDKENAFPFKASWASATELYYVADGKIRRRSTTGGAASTVEFTATFTVNPANYTRRRRDVDSKAPRKALGIVRPAISPDGKQVAFAALGDVWVMPVGGKPVNLTKDSAFDTDPAWSPDGTQLAYASDKGGPLMNVWIRDLKSGAARKVTTLTTSALAPTWSPDGARIAFLDVDGIWGQATPSVLDVATGAVTKLHDPIFAPGNPTWSPDGRRIAMAVLQPYSRRFREGTNQILTFSSTAGAARSDDQWMIPVKHLSLDSRVGGGPAWSPDGSRMAVIYEGMLSLVTVAPDGTPLGPPRRVTGEMAHMPSWTADSKHVLYQSNEKLRLLDVETGRTSDVPLDLTWTPAIPAGRVVVHAGQLVDGKAETARKDMDVVVEGNRIKSVGPHSAALHASAKVVDATGLTVIPGLVEHHAHLQKDFGTVSGRAYLAFGITTMRSPGGSPYESVEYKEAVDAGVRPGPRIFSTGYLMEWNRVYYNMAVAVSSPAHLDLELARAKALGHDMVKSYVRMPDLMQKRIIESAHAAGIPVSSHEIFPSSLSGIDMTEHTGATSRRGFSPKQASLQATYDDVIQLFLAAKMPITPTFGLGGAGLREIVAHDTTLRSDPRFAMYPPWLVASVTGGGGGGRGGRGGRGSAAPAAAAPANPLAGIDPSNAYSMVMRILKGGGSVLTGTDTPLAPNLNGELVTFVNAGMTPYQALRAATVEPAKALGIDAGTIEAGKLADLVVLDGNPLTDVTATVRVRQVMANGKVYALADLLAPR